MWATVAPGFLPAYFNLCSILAWPNWFRYVLVASVTADVGATCDVARLDAEAAALSKGWAILLEDRLLIWSWYRPPTLSVLLTGLASYATRRMICCQR
jgi:hypothetical protein